MTFYVVVTRFGSRIYVCDLCRIAFDDFKKLLAHRTVHSRSQYLLMVSKPSTRGRRMYVRNEVKSKMVVPCDSYPRKSKNLVFRKTHVKSCVPCKMIKCEFCAFTTRYQPKLKAHLAANHDNYFSVIKKELKNHERHDDNNLLCEQCGKFVLRKSLQRHRNMHTQKSSKTPLTCPICFGTFKTKNQYMRHRRIHSTNGGEISVRTPVQESILQWLLEERKGPRHQCDTCQETFHRKDALDKHYSIKHKVELYMCDKCGKRFTYSETLRSHYRVHFLRNFMCEICSKFLKGATELKSHLRMHEKTDNKSACEVCGNNFCTLFSLREHMKTHAAMKSFECKECGKNLASLVVWKRHTKKHLKITNQ